MPVRKALKDTDVVIRALRKAFDGLYEWHGDFDSTNPEHLRFLINEFLVDDRIRLEVIDPDIPVETKWVTGE